MTLPSAPGRPSELVRLVLERTASQTPHRFVAGDGSITELSAADVLRGALQTAELLVDAGLAPGDVVVVRDRGATLSACQAVVGGALAGLTVVPAVAALGDADVEGLLDASGARAVLVGAVDSRGASLDPWLESVGAARPELVVLPLQDHRGVDPDVGIVRALPPDAPAFILFTSGTTAEPKGVIHTHETVLAEIDDFAGQLDLRRDGCLLQTFPVGHIGGLVGLMLALALDRPSVMLESWNAVAAFDAIDRFEVTGFGTTPFFAQTLFDECERLGRGLPTVRVMTSGGGVVGRDLVVRADALGIVLLPCYGSSEHPSVCTHSREDPVEVRASSEGRPTGGSQIRIVDTDGADRPAGADGEIAVRGPEQFVGYLSGDTSSLLTGGWFRTGDLGRLVDGRLVITGRVKEIIIRGGENISIAELESVLLAHPAVDQVAVVGLPDERYGERVHAFVVPARGALVPTVGEVREFFADRGLARHKAPAGVDAVPDLPRNAMGKVQRNLLVQRVGAGVPTNTPQHCDGHTGTAGLSQKAAVNR